MGKRGNKRSSAARGGRQRAQRADYTEVTKRNALFEKYYNELGIVPDCERDDFAAFLRKELPISFRFTGSRGHAIPVRQRLKDHYVPEISAIEYEGAKVDPPVAISWFPDELAWQMTTPKNVIRRFPPFASFQKFLVSETSVGHISRQEAVSMIPPLLMSVTAGMTVLDLCAAPGSKTAQLIEMVHGGEEARVRKVVQNLGNREAREPRSDESLVELDGPAEEQEDDWSDEGRTTGLIIANDCDYKRAQMLIHQTKRLSSPNLIVTNHDATMFPSIKLPVNSTSEHNHSPIRYLKFDRVLADVPCSGDGTCRKNVNVWKDWTPGNALGLFSTQVRILVRALQLLKVGGRAVYSTCSMNPVENEAVVATAIERCGGLTHVELGDCSNLLPKLQRRPGLKSWKVMDKTGRCWQSWAEFQVEVSENNNESLGKLSESMFPRPEGLEALPLERCMRLYPHLQNTGGFFITVLQKKKEIRAKPENESKSLAPKPSIIAAVDGIESHAIDGIKSVSRIDALDGIAPPRASAGANVQSAAARQNQENDPDEIVTSQKRDFHAEADAEASTKRLRLREPGDAVEDPTPQGTADRKVHWPPPPGAKLDVSHPEMVDMPEPEVRTGDQKRFNKPRPNQAFEEPFKYLASNHEELRSIQEFYQLSSKFPMTRFMVRNATGHPAKTMYYTSALARDILTENEGKGIKFVHCGIKMFVRQDVQKENVCKWRIQTEGLPIIEPWVGEDRVVKLWNRSTLRNLLVEMFPKVVEDGWKDLGEIGERVRDISMGCCVLRIEPRESQDGFRERMVLPLWRSLYSLNLMLPKEDRKAMLLRLFNDDSPLQDHSKDRLKIDVSLPADGVPDAESEAKAIVERDEGFKVAEAANDDNDDDDKDLEEGGVAIGSLGGEGIITRPAGSDAVIPKYDNAMGADNPAE